MAYFSPPYLRRSERPAKEITNFTNLYVKNFPLAWTEESMSEELGLVWNVG